MNFRYRDWRVLARFRELPGLNSAAEFRQALLLQMTPTELATYRRRHSYLILVVLALGAASLLLPWSLMLLTVWFLLSVLYRLWYWRIDPITMAAEEYNRRLEAVVRQECKTARQQRIDAGL